MTKRLSRGLLVAGLLATLAGGSPPFAAAAPPSAAGETLQSLVDARTSAILDALEKDGNFAGAERKLGALFDRVTLVGSDKNLEAFREGDFALRMVRQVETLPKEKRGELLTYLRANPNLARTLAFLINDDKEAAGAYLVLERLRAKHGAELDAYANLAAAICVVHDRPFTRQINENLTTAPDAVDLFEYYTANEKSMLFGVKNVPAELLMYVVDTTSSIPEMRWALRKYAGDQNVGRHFFDIAYDYDNLKTAREKEVTKAGYNLPNILKFGGVCADQAFFAMEIGKAIGVPTTYTTASSAEVGHAWVGFLQTKGDKLFWNFDVGRYEEYRGIRGNVEDPQTREDIPDSYVSLLAELLGSPAHRTKTADRQEGIAVTDAALRLANAAVGAEALQPAAMEETVTDALKVPRAVTTEAALGLLETALNENVGYRPAWFLVAGLAQDNKLTAAEKTRWGTALLTKCGASYPDFALTVLEPMIGTVSDAAQQDAMWAAAETKFQGRSDLVAEILMNRAALWEQKQATAKAGNFYLEIVDRYCNAGPFVIPALAKAEELLGDQKGKVLQMYSQSWAKIQKPEDMAGPFMEQSNWFRVGRMYGEKLELAGQTGAAARVYGMLGVREGTGGT
jgi:hypothetical protein